MHNSKWLEIYVYYELTSFILYLIYLLNVYIYIKMNPNWLVIKYRYNMIGTMGVMKQMGALYTVFVSAESR